MPTPRKIERGQKLAGLPAASWNAFVDTYNRVRQMPPRGNGTGASSPLGPVLVEVKNDSGGAVAAGGILKIETPIITPGDRAEVVYEGLQFIGDTPDGSGTVAILQEPLDDGAIGVGVIPGASWARVNVTDAGHGFALATAATTTLQSDPSAGLPVLWKPSGTGEKWCVILLHSTAAGNVILASVNGDVDSGDPTGLFDGAVAIVGEIPPGGSGTFINEYQQEYADNDLAILLQRQDNGDWYAERGGTAGSIVVTYELTQDMAYADTAKLAKPVDETGAIISGADAFYVLDEQEKFYGKSGYQGIALKTKNDHSGGVPGYRIVTMEGPAHLMTGVLAGSYSVGGTSFTPSTAEPWGRPFRGRRLPSSGSITVYDDISVASDAQVGDKWLIAWNEADERYYFVASLEPSEARFYRFETTAAKAWNAATVAGVLLDASDVSGAAITLTDRTPAKHEAQSGSRGWCLYGGGTNYYIITIDSPARWIEGPLDAAWDIDATSGTVELDGDFWGAAPNHLEPEYETTTQVTIHDPLKLRQRNLIVGEVLRAVWDEKRAQYVLAAPPEPFITIRGLSPGVTRGTTTFTLGSPEAVNGRVPTGTIVVTNDPKCDCPSGETIYARFNMQRHETDLAQMWDTGDGANTLWHLRGYLDWSDAVTEEDAKVLECYGELEPHWHGSAPCDESPGG